MEVEETVFQKESRTLRPLCRLLGIRADGAYSKGLQEAVVDFAAHESFEKAAQGLSRHHPVKLCAGTVRKITLMHGRRMCAEQEQSGGVGVVAHEGPAHIVAEIDGTMLPVVSFEKGRGDRRKRRQCEWTEAKLCAAQAMGSASIRYGCTLGGAEPAGNIWAHCVSEQGWAKNTHIHVVSDGAEWIARQTREQFKESATQLIDFYHVSEYLAAASETLPECRRKQWRKLQQRRLLRGDAPKVIKALRLHSEAEALAQEQAPMRHALQYMEKRAGCFDYPKAQKEGLPIGSGLIEGGHRHVLQKRLKISGAWWLRQNAAAMAALSVVMENNDWLSYWKSVA